MLLICYLIYKDFFLQALGVFGLCQILGGINYLKTKIIGDDFQTLFQFIIYLIGGVVIAVGTLLTISGKHIYILIIFL
jgi:hypothetical protein